MSFGGEELIKCATVWCGTGVLGQPEASRCTVSYGGCIMPFLGLAGEGAVYPSVAVSPCQILNGIDREGRR